MTDGGRELHGFPGIFVDQNGFVLFRRNGEGVREDVSDEDIAAIGRAFSDPNWLPDKEASVACDKDCDCVDGKDVQELGVYTGPRFRGADFPPRSEEKILPISDQVIAYHAKLSASPTLHSDLIDRLTIDFQQALLKFLAP